jgi:hypothetical protein
MLTSYTGPLLISGQGPAIVSGSAPADYNADAGPSAIAVGTMLLDGRYITSQNSQAGEQAAIGLYNGGNIIAIDQIPSQLATNNIAAAHTVTTGTPMTLVSSSGAGITVTTAATFINQTGRTIPSGALAIDTAYATIKYGQNSTMAVTDPTHTIARAVSITTSATATGGHLIVNGYDLWGFPQTEDINAAGGGGATTNGAKAWKYITSVVPQFTDSTGGHTYAVGTADIFGFPIACYRFAYATIVWNDARITASTGFTAAVTTTPSSTTGDVRGTYATQDASDGTKRLQIFINISPVNAGTLNGTASVFGQVPA